METIKLDLVPGKKMPSLHASQYDKETGKRLELCENRVPFELDGTETLSIIVRKVDNTLVSMDVANVFGGKTYVDFLTTEQMCACAGYNFGELRIERNGERLGTGNFYLCVEEAPDEGGITSQSEINNLNRQITDEVDRILPDMVDEVADPIVRELVPEVVGDNYYDKEQTDAKIGEAVEDKVDEDTFNESLSNKYEQKLTQTLKVGENILTEASVALGANWSGTLASGLSHSSGSTESLEFNVPTTNNKPYLVSFEAPNVSNANALSVCIGDTPLVDIYNGESEFYIGIVSDGGNLTITPKSTYNGTITNLKLREISNEGDEVTFEAKNVNTKDNQGGLSGFWNVAIGFDNFEKNENGSRNVAIGFESLHDFKSGTRNLALGTFAMHRLESGDRNIAVGADSMWYAKKATDCIALGHDSMNGVGTDIEHDIAIGQESLSGLTTGKQNIAIGYGSMEYPQNGGIVDTVSVGVQSGNYAHSNCTYIGTRAGYFLKGAGNTCLGKQAGAQQNTTGQQNTFLGVQCGIDNTGATASNPKTVDNSIAIGYQARATKSNQAMIGSANVTEVVFCGNKKINFNNDGTVTWETLT